MLILAGGDPWQFMRCSFANHGSALMIYRPSAFTDCLYSFRLRGKQRFEVRGAEKWHVAE